MVYVWPLSHSFGEFIVVVIVVINLVDGKTSAGVS
jgi:hypothetical protein